MSENETGLTADQLKALRNADTIVLRWFPEGSTDGEPGAAIECIKEHDPGDGFGKRDLPRVIIPILLPHLDNYTGYHGGTKREVRYVTWVLHSNFRDDPARTLVQDILRKGDQIRPMLTIGNQTTTMRDRNIGREDLAVEILRGKKRLVVSLDTWVLDNCTTGSNIRLY